jgi:hypothetical protein
MALIILSLKISALVHTYLSTLGYWSYMNTVRHRSCVWSVKECTLLLDDSSSRFGTVDSVIYRSNMYRLT